MKTILRFSCGHRVSSAAWAGRLAGLDCTVRDVDLYALDAALRDDAAALLIGMHMDQRFLQANAALLNDYVAAGGRVAISGHVAHPFLDGLTPVRPLDGGGIADLTVARAVAHPIWEGVALEDLTFRRGVAGFYGHAWHAPPEGATVIHTLGPARRPLDFIWRLGRGAVLFHGGNDLWSFGGDDTTRRLLPQLVAWLTEDRS
ncbi:hypothetical protein PQJ75_25325 [Rhodoplanes sp. TEM]|uniref:ThuA-like domain-containing protein n=1 Tax=Rhodoplanes tepidamans TaxID=200616 RepID=A0ABT5JJA9_RHOTP|nr:MULTISPECIES: hypothetical protein [Rhodoplanes]MDC7789659.1 hypothetical protein [Rhodoplanes tepidamans]MDC7987066.1 hypothetical protein [Rhodoplanes sp. TEM]MDQ0353595.1 hypothetical protein [Rhodoplanes tepidamans]